MFRKLARPCCDRYRRFDPHHRVRPLVRPSWPLARRHWHRPRCAGDRLASECYVVKKVVETPFGLRVRRITVCN
jgi:hypothetical protein